MASALMVNATGYDGAGSGSPGVPISQVWPFATVIRYFVLANSGLTPKSTEVYAQIAYRTNGVLSYLHVKIPENNLTDGDTVIRTRKNSGNGNQNITISAGVTGEFIDTTNTDIIIGSAADKWNYSVAVGPASELDSIADIVISVISILFTATTNTVTRYAAVQFADLSDGATTFYAIAGYEDAANDTEAKSKFNLNAAADYTNIYAYLSTHPGGSGMATVLRKDGADTSISLSISGTGTFEYTGTAVNFAANTNINYSVVSFNSSSIIMEVLSIEATSADKTFHSVFARSAGYKMSANVTGYYPVGGGPLAVGIESAVRIDINMAAIVSNLTLYVSANTIV